MDTQIFGAILRALNNYVIGTALREATDQPSTSTDTHTAYQTAMAAYLRQITTSGYYPLMSTLSQAVLDGTLLTADQGFETGLSCLLDGISALIAQQ